MADTYVGKLARRSAVALSLLGACATEMQETNTDLAPLEPNGGSGGASGSAGDTAGTDPVGTSGSATDETGGMAGTPGSAGMAGASAGAGGQGGAASGGNGGNGGTAGSGGAGGKASGGNGGMAGTGGAPANPCEKVKLAIKAATASSIENAGHPATDAFDGDAVTSRWASLQGVDPQWLYVDLGEVAHVSRVVLTWEVAFASAYKIEIADATGGPWTSMLQENAGNGATDDLTNLTAGNGRYVRMYGTARGTGYGYSIYEFEVYGDLDETCK